MRHAGEGHVVAAVVVYDVACEHQLALEAAGRQRCGAPYYLLTLPSHALNHEDVVVVAYPVAVCTLGTQSLSRVLEVSVRDDRNLLAQRDVALAVGMYLAHKYLMALEGGVGVHHILLALRAGVVEEETRVVAHLHLVAVPSPLLYVVAGEDIRLGGGVAGDDDIVESLIFIVAQVGCPRAVGILALAVLQREAVQLLQLVVGIAYHCPVDEVVTLHKRAARRHVHGGANHIERVAHAQDVGVGNVGVDQRIGKSAVTIVAYLSYGRRCKDAGGDQHRRQEKRLEQLVGRVFHRNICLKITKTKIGIDLKHSTFSLLHKRFTK